MTVTNERAQAIDVPAEIPSRIVVANVSGGKDSTAMICALREAGVAARYVFADTGWEHETTYQQIEAIERALGIVVARVAAGKTMRAKIAERAGFPGRMQRWCTEELKLDPLRDYHDAIEDLEGLRTVCAVGVRAEESAKRAAMPIFAEDDAWKGLVWRPIMHWTVEEVLNAHHRHGIPIHPLYQRGHNRVGCYPCVLANKEEIRLIAQHDPAIIDEIEAMEVEATAERARRNEVEPGRYKHPIATFFQTRQGITPTGIREVVAWSKTSRGGRQLSLLAPVPTGGCTRWGLCEPPTETVIESAVPALET